jgi:cystathionine beta-synthase
MKTETANKTVLDLIGNTPMVEVTHFDTGKCRLFLKLESHNPGGSIKDRIGLSMINHAERQGMIKKGGTLVEATAGNTGLGLALVAAIKGYKLILVIPDKMSREKVMHLKAMGAEIVITRSDVGKGHPEYYQDLAMKIAQETPEAFFVDQFSNPANPLAHETTTGPEIYKQLNGEVDAVVCGVGSSGTVTGLSHFFNKVKPGVEMVIADPEGSVIADYIKNGTIKEAGSWLVEGIGEDFIPGIADFSMVHHAYSISDKDSLHTARQLLQKEGILAGSSSGTLLAAAILYCREQVTAKNVVTFVCDSGNKYLTKMYDDYWMQDQEMIEAKSMGNLLDMVKRTLEEKEVVFVEPTDTLLHAYKKLKLHDVSQLPVLQNGKIIGILDQTDILGAVMSSRNGFSEPVKEWMTKDLKVNKPNDSLKDVVELINQGMTPLLCEGDRFIGLITAIDVLDHFKRKSR